MARCPYMTSLLVADPGGPGSGHQIVYSRCRRRAWSRGWHLHDAPVPEALAAVFHRVRLRWRSTYAPDHHVSYTPGRSAGERVYEDPVTYSDHDRTTATGQRGRGDVPPPPERGSAAVIDPMYGPPDALAPLTPRDDEDDSPNRIPPGGY